MMSRQTSTALCLHVCAYPKRQTDAIYCGSCRNVLIVYLYSQHDVVLLALRWEPQLHIISFIFRTVLAALAGFAEGAKQSTEVVKGCEEFLCTPLCAMWTIIWMALHYPCEKRLVVLFKLLRYEQGLNKLPRTHWCMVGTHKASTCARECLITRCSLRPNHPQICGAWIAPAWWPIVVSANQGNTSSIIQFCS